MPGDSQIKLLEATSHFLPWSPGATSPLRSKWNGQTLFLSISSDKKPTAYHAEQGTPCFVWWAFLYLCCGAVEVVVVIIIVLALRFTA